MYLRPRFGFHVPAFDFTLQEVTGKSEFFFIASGHVCARFSNLRLLSNASLLIEVSHLSRLANQLVMVTIFTVSIWSAEN